MLDFPKTELKILRFWKKNKIFEKLRRKIKGKKRWSFLDGPITANNPMGVHHAWGRTYKDLFQRYKAMRGFDQRFQNGFDCQGLWVEVEVEKELGFKTKKDIESYGVSKFIEKCKERVKKYSKIQTEQSVRLGQWMDWENSYYTMSDENNYAIWHFLKKCHEDGILYKGRDSVPWCPRCGTAISQHEILTEEYKLIIHESVYFKLPIIAGDLAGAKLLAWTTTPWTIPANVALAVNPDFKYGVFEKENEKLILLESLAPKILGGDFRQVQSFSGKELKGLKYEAPFDGLERVALAKKEHPETFHSVVLEKNLVTELEGTGVVHIAPGAGEEDFKVGMREKLPVIDVIDEAANYLDLMDGFSGKNAKENPEIIVERLKNYEQGRFLYKTEDYEHRYPTCWRCKKELVWRVVDEWYIAMDKPSKLKNKNEKRKARNLREELVRAAKKINWIPSFGLERELDWLKNMHDWLISKKRYWGLALPIFECACGNFEVVGSKEELKERAAEGWELFSGHSPHRPWIDKVKIRCLRCGEKISRIPDVGNPWLDAGIIPFSTLIDPATKKLSYTADQKHWRRWFPIDFVTESFPGQFKNWFYSILTMSVVLEKTSPVKTILGFASVRDEKGEEMHKSKGNAIWLDDAVREIGADTMRWMYFRANPALNFKFGYKTAKEAKRQLLTLWNSYIFFKTYVAKNEIPKKEPKSSPKNILDRWIASRLNNLIFSIEAKLDIYDSAGAAALIENFFVNDLSLWYIRRSRKRLQEKNNSQGRKEIISTLYSVLLSLTKLIAPALPFFAEEIYSGLKQKNMPQSIHLCGWPKAEKGKINRNLEMKMETARGTVAAALALRAEAKIKVRQPLGQLKIKNAKLKTDKELLKLIMEEVNVKEIVFDGKIKNAVELDTTITKELGEEGMVRDVIRQIQEMRKKSGFKPRQKIVVFIFGPSRVNEVLIKDKKYIAAAVRLKDFILERDDKAKFIIEDELEVDGGKIWLAIKKI